MQINSLSNLTKVGSVLFKDFKEPSIFDLEDLQEPPKEFLAKLETPAPTVSIPSDNDVEIVDDDEEEECEGEELGKDETGASNSRKASTNEESNIKMSIGDPEKKEQELLSEYIAFLNI
jgi:hypothetical protein